MIICVNVLIYQKMISLSSMISGKSQGLKLKVKDSLKPLWTRFLSNPKRLRPTACEVCTVNSITGGVLTWSVGILQSLRCTLLLAELAGSHETLLQPAARYHSMSAKSASYTPDSPDPQGPQSHSTCKIRGWLSSTSSLLGTKSRDQRICLDRTWNERLNGGFQSDDSHGGTSNFHPF